MQIPNFIVKTAIQERAVQPMKMVTDKTCNIHMTHKVQKIMSRKAYLQLNIYLTFKSYNLLRCNRWN